MPAIFRKARALPPKPFGDALSFPELSGPIPTFAWDTAPREAHSWVGNALSALSWRLRVPAPSRKAALEMERRCSPLLF